VLVSGGRVAGVATATGLIHAPRVVICGGAWSGLIGSGGPRLPVKPVRGQMLALASSEARLDRIVFTERGYLVPRLDGPILVGSTAEDAGFEASATAGGMRALLDLACAVVPALERAAVAGIWAGLRPASQDGLPILGPAGSRWPDGLFFATGHFRNGILLAPLTARLVAEAIVSGRTSVPLEPFLASRFVS